VHHFHDRNGGPGQSSLWAEDVDLARIAAEVGTPTYVYSRATLERHYRVIAEAFAGRRLLIAFSVKACPNIGVVATLARLGAGADVVSEGEARRALAAGIPASKIVFSGVGKTPAELAFAVDARVGQINLESEPELESLAAIAASKGARAPIAVRVNPDVAAGGHAKISTGKKSDKFGIPWERARAVYARAKALPGVRVIGVDFHIGSQIAELAPFEAATRRVADLVTMLRAEGHEISRVDLGGGLGIPYRDSEEPPPPADYARVVTSVLDPLDVEIVLEPGRVIAGNAGILLTRVIYVKEGAASRFVILDSAMNDLIRPALYDAWHDIRPVKTPAPDAQLSPVDIVGPVCESTDAFARNRPFPPVAAGDLVAIMSAGAYGSSQSSEYNSRPRAAEVLVDGSSYTVIRPRRSYDDMLAEERIPPAL
jgi:diaminopimelate decarboxylase